MNDIKAENREMTRYVRKEMARFPIDCGDVQVTVYHGNVTLNGRVRPLSGHADDFDSSLHLLLKAIHSMHGVREVHPDWKVVN